MKKPDNAKERGLIKGAIRRVFSRSELRRQALDASRVQHTDSTRPRVTKWSKCPNCNEFTPTYLMEVDHVIPLVGITEKLEDLTWDQVVERLWCDVTNLMALCKRCHKIKSQEENKLRRLNNKKRVK